MFRALRVLSKAHAEPVFAKSAFSPGKSGMLKAVPCVSSGQMVVIDSEEDWLGSRTNRRHCRPKVICMEYSVLGPLTRIPLVCHTFILCGASSWLARGWHTLPSQSS